MSSSLGNAAALHTRLGELCHPCGPTRLESGFSRSPLWFRIPDGLHQKKKKKIFFFLERTLYTVFFFNGITLHKAINYIFYRLHKKNKKEEEGYIPYKTDTKSGD